MMIGPAIMGIVGAAGANLNEFTQTPHPVFVHGDWWSFTPLRKSVAPRYGIVARRSTDRGATWVKESTTFSDLDPLQRVPMSIYGNNRIAGLGPGSTRVAAKRLDVPDADFTYTSIADIAGGATDAGGGVLHHANGLFVLTKVAANTIDIYTSTDCVTWTPINGETTSDLESIVNFVYNIWHNGTDYVALGRVGASTGRATATSSDLVNWTATGEAVFDFENVRWFKDRYLAIRPLSGTVWNLYSSTDLITWTDVTPAELTSPSGRQLHFSKVISNANRYVIICTSFTITTTDAINFTVADINCQVADSRLESDVVTTTDVSTTLVYDVQGDFDAMATSGTKAGDFMMKTLSMEEFGGKVMRWEDGLDKLPVVVYPAEPLYGDILGGIGQSAEYGGGLYDGGMGNKDALWDNPAIDSTFYQFMTGKRYLEFTINRLDVGGGFEIGVRAQPNDFIPAGDVEKFAFFEDGDYEIDNTSPVSTPWSPAVGDTVGITMDFDTNTIFVYTNNVQRYTSTLLGVEQWVPFWMTQGCDITLNIGQAPFTYDKEPTFEAWAGDLVFHQGGLTGDNLPLVPEPLFSGGEWKSSVWGDEDDYGLPHTGRGVVVSATSPNDVDWTQINLDPDVFFTTPNRRLRPSGFGGDIIYFQGGIWVYYKDGDANWVALSLSSIPNGNVGGGLIHFINYANGLFLVAKATAFGFDLATTPDFVSWDIPSVDFNEAQGVYGLSDVPFTIKYIGSQYVAYYELNADGTIQAATSTDLITWVADSTSLPAPTGATSQGARKKPYTSMAYFNGKHITHFVDLPNGDDNLKTLHIWYSSDGLDWTEVSITNALGNEGMDWYVTSTAIELVTATHLFRSTDGTTWVESLMKHSLPKLCSAKGDPGANITAPDHIAFPYGITTVEGGKILGFAGVNSVPTVKYPVTTPEDAVVGWLRTQSCSGCILPDKTYMLRDSGFTASAVDDQFRPMWSIYCRDSGTYYYEITVLFGAAPMLIGAQTIGASYYSASGTKETSVLLRNGWVETNLDADVGVTYTSTIGQVLGFLFDSAAGTLVISVDGTTLHTATNLETARSWVPYLDFKGPSGLMWLNVGQDPFSHNSTGATAWKD